MFTTPEQFAAANKASVEAMLSLANTALASAEKIGAASPFEVLALSEVAGIVTDVPADHPERRRLRDSGVPLLIP